MRLIHGIPPILNINLTHFLYEIQEKIFIFSIMICYALFDAPGEIGPYSNSLNFFIVIIGEGFH